jgi:hypothetical protein
MYSCTEVGPDIFQRTKTSSLCSVEIKAPPEVVFASLECAEDWPLWAPAIRRVEWTSPPPFGVGTTRTVTMPGLTGKETFITWDNPNRMAFCFSDASMPGIDIFAEDYEITPLEGSRSKLTWTVVIVPKGIGRISMGICSPFLQFFNQWMLNRLKRLLESRLPP